MVNVLVLYRYCIDFPKGMNARPASLKCCSPNGIPIMVMQNSSPRPMCVRAIGIPPTIHHITFISRLRQPLEVGDSVTAVPNGVKATTASFIVCNPKGIPTIVIIIVTLDNTYSTAMIQPPNTIHIILSSKFIVTNISISPLFIKKYFGRMG